MSAFSTQMGSASNQLYAVHGRSATYTTRAGAASTVTVRGAVQPQQQTSDFSEWTVTTTDVATPAVGDKVTVDGVVFRVETYEPRPGSNWKLFCSGVFGTGQTAGGIV